MDEEDNWFRISKHLNLNHGSLLYATPDDPAHGTIQELKCRLCPEAGFSNWNKFRRQCEKMEVHPRKISFCRHCGDFFACKDRLVQHESRPLECLSITEAEAAVRTEMREVHDTFQRSA